MAQKPIILEPNVPAVLKPKGYANILRLFQTHIVELRFLRKTPLPKVKGVGHLRKTRRMLCTSNWKLISSPLTSKIFKWRKPKGPTRGYSWYKERQLLIVWDLLELDWRIVYLKDWKLIAMIPVQKMLEKQAFVEFYKARTARMSKLSRKKFADKY